MNPQTIKGSVFDRLIHAIFDSTVDATDTDTGFRSSDIQGSTPVTKLTRKVYP